MPPSRLPHTSLVSPSDLPRISLISSLPHIVSPSSLPQHASLPGPPGRERQMTSGAPCCDCSRCRDRPRSSEIIRDRPRSSEAPPPTDNGRAGERHAATRGARGPDSAKHAPVERSTGGGHGRLGGVPRGGESRAAAAVARLRSPGPQAQRAPMSPQSPSRANRRPPPPPPAARVRRFVQPCPSTLKPRQPARVRR